MASILSQITSECTGNSNDWTKNCPVNNTEHTNLRDKFLLSLVQSLNPREVQKKVQVFLKSPGNMKISKWAKCKKEKDKKCKSLVWAHL